MLPIVYVIFRHEHDYQFRLIYDDELVTGTLPINSHPSKRDDPSDLAEADANIQVLINESCKLPLVRQPCRSLACRRHHQHIVQRVS